MQINERFVERAIHYIGYGPQIFNAYFGTPMGTAWCAEFVCKCADDVGAIGKCIVKTAGAGSIPRESIAKYGGTWYEGYSSYKPKPGDIIVFTWNGEGQYPGQDKYFSDHVGVVEKVSGNTVYTIEGNANGTNTSSTVCRRSYTLKSGKINGYFHPNWVLADKSYKENGGSTPTPDPKPVKNSISEVQTYLRNKYNCTCAVDGEYGPKTKAALVGSLQCCLNKYYHSGLTVDGIMGPKTKKACPVLNNGFTHPIVYILQGALICRGYDTGGFDGEYGPKTALAVTDFQKKHCREVDGLAGPETFYELLK